MQTDTKLKTYFLISIFTGMVLGLTACGHDDDDDDDTAATETGVFKDSAVAGLSFRSGTLSGTTGNNGQFSYQTNQPVLFSVGGVELGTASGAEVVTPLDLFDGADLNDSRVINVARFIQMLDQDGNADNGIVISSAVQEIAANWSSVDFASTNFDNDMVSIISDATSVDGVTHSLPSATAALAHLTNTIRCLYAGAYRGSYSGDDSGPVSVVVDTNSGLVSGFAYSREDQDNIDLTGQSALDLSAMGLFVSGNTNTGATFEGGFNSYSSMTGNWSNTIFNYTGSFSTNKVLSASSGQYLFSGLFQTDDGDGTFSFVIDTDGNVSGIAHTIGLSDAEEETIDFSGIHESSTNLVSGATSDGETAFNFVVDLNAGTLTGSFLDDSATIPVQGTGCLF